MLLDLLVWTLFFFLEQKIPLYVVICPSEAGFPLANIFARSDFFPLSLSLNKVQAKEKGRFARKNSLLPVVGNRLDGTQWRSQPDIWSCKCKVFCFYRPYKESISKEMNNDNDICIAKCRAGFAIVGTYNHLTCFEEPPNLSVWGHFMIFLGKKHRWTS